MFKFSEESNYMMPAHFGGWPGRPQAATYHDVTSIAVSYETDPGMLTAFIPEPFEMTESALSIQYSMCRRVDWMGGGGYNLIGRPTAPSSISITR
jgi:acetoacetate decarboxylase